jgi:hypothetical protein
MDRVRSWGLGLALGALALSAQAGRPHEHGVARLDVAVEPARITVFLDVALDGLVGFERAPRDDAERARADAALARLRGAGEMFRIDPAARCTLARVDLVAPVLGLGPAPANGGKAGEHADLEGSFDFDCADAAKAGFVEVGLFEAFPRLARIDVQAATRRGQLKATLRRPAARVALPR